MTGEEKLVRAAKAARLKAHAPYSDFLVGCAVEGEDGAIAVGANMENACYRLGVCAEQSALTAALQIFGLERVKRLVVIGGPRDGSGTDGPVTPCGGCRQAISEAAVLSGHDIEIVCFDADGGSRTSFSISQLLPAAFEL
ncbi:cytidine deaminase [Erythrobacter alti]|uniref:cytidine deaminase n=1 Tax=Erythrobacter alti TaxID=1896145 RepID=UPI0030F457FF